MPPSALILDRSSLAEAEFSNSDRDRSVLSATDTTAKSLRKKRGIVERIAGKRQESSSKTISKPASNEPSSEHLYRESKVLADGMDGVATASPDVITTGAAKPAAPATIPSRNAQPGTSADRKQHMAQTDLDLLQAFQQGNERAFVELYSRRKSELYTFCLRMLGGDRDLASDAFQETFIKVYEKADTFKSGTNVLGWLFMIARNTCLNIYRTKKPQEALEYHPSLESKDRSLGPEYRHEQDFLREILEQAIASLPEEFREPFILREFDGFSYTEIAEMTGTTLAMTKVRIHRAKQRMREILRPYLHEDEMLSAETARTWRVLNTDPGRRGK